MGGGYGNEALLFAAPSVAEADERERRLKAAAERQSAGPWWGSGALPRPSGPWGWGFGAPEPKAADYAKSVAAPPPDAEATRIAAAGKAQADADALKKLQGERAASLEGVTTDLPGGGWSQARADAHQSLPSVLKRLTLEQAASERAPRWENDGSLGQILGDAGARELLDTKYAMENERISKEAAANDPQRRDLESRRLNAAADEFIARDRGQRLPTLGGIYDRSKPRNWTPGLFEMETDAAGRETFVNSNPRSAGATDGKAAAMSLLMEGLSRAMQQSEKMPDDQREAFIQQALLEIGLRGATMGIGKEMAAVIEALGGYKEAQGNYKKSIADAALEAS